MRLPKDYAAPRQEETAIEYIWEQRGCVQQRREPIVRCRDCAWFENPPDYGAYCTSFGSPLDDYDGYCAWGERKADA